MWKKENDTFSVPKNTYLRKGHWILSFYGLIKDCIVIHVDVEEGYLRKGIAIRSINQSHSFLSVSLYLSISLSLYPPISLSISLSLSFYLFIYLSIYLYKCTYLMIVS